MREFALLRRFVLVLGCVGVFWAGCNINQGPPSQAPPTGMEPDGSGMEPDEPDMEPDPPVDSPSDDDGARDDEERFMADELLSFVMAVDTGDGPTTPGAVDFRDLTVGDQIVFSIPDETASMIRQVAGVCDCAWSVESLDGDPTPVGSFSVADDCMTVFTVERSGDGVISATQTCPDGSEIRFEQGMRSLAGAAGVDDETPGDEDPVDETPPGGNTGGGGGGGGGDDDDDDPPPPVETVILTVALDGDGDFNVTPAGTPVAVADGQGFEFEVGTAVTLTAVDTDGGCFLRWGGDLSAMASAVVVTVDADVFVLGEFVDRMGAPAAPVLNPLPSLTTSESVVVSGTVSTCQVDATTSVVINGPATTVQATPVDGVFSAEMPLALNQLNHLVVTPMTAAGAQGVLSSVDVTHDAQAPTLFIDFPVDGAEVTNASIDVAGRVSDMLSGFAGLTVEVNGVAAIVDVGIGTNGTFERSAIPLSMGANTITAVATDSLGNFRQTSISVSRVAIPAGSPSMAAMTGNGQSGMILSTLGNPLIVQVLNGAGQPFANKVVTFDVTRSDGTLSAEAPGPSGTGSQGQLLQIRTDAQGMARAYWQLGSDAGCGNNRVEVRSNGIAGTTFFCASATPGPPAQINIGTGNMQRSEVGSVAPDLLRAWVNDMCNGVSGIPVTFTVTKGGGRVNDQTSVTLVTSDTGHAEVSLKLGPAPGNNVVQADFPGNPVGPAEFMVWGVQRQTTTAEGFPTSFEGVVFNNNNQPIQGASVTLFVGNVSLFSTVTDVEGMFKFEDMQTSGPADLLIDGLVATHVGGMAIDPGTFPALHFEPMIIPKSVNSLPTPIVLPTLNPDNAVAFDNTEDVELTVAGIEGLKMIVKAGSMTRADGTVPSPADPAVLALNQVHFDKVPMPMPDGAAPPFSWTLQPGGARFDPPVTIEYPNMTGLAPGSISYFLSFNHDTMRFEIVATGSVSEDGSRIVTDPGSGIETAGWGCNCPPYSVTAECANCTITLENLGEDVVFVDDTVLLQADGEPDPGEMTWSGGGDPATGSGSFFSTKFDTPGMKSITAEWDAEDAEEPCEFTIEIMVAEAQFKEDPGQTYGFDSRTDPAAPYKSIETSSNDGVRIDLGTATPDVVYTSANDSVVDVQPGTSTGPVDNLTLASGDSEASTNVQARFGSASGDLLATLQTSVYEKISKTVALVLVHEENDDVQEEAVGFVGTADTVCVSAGTNAFRDTDAENDDVVDGNDIKAGPDMTCDTTAESVDYLSTDIASDAVLQEWMNEKVYNQSVIEWTLSRQPAITVNFDLDRDYQVGVMTWMTPEMAAIRDAAVAAGVTGFDHVIFFVDDPDDGSGGFSEFNQIYAFVHVDSITEAGVSGVPEQVCSHELGHAQGLMHQMPDATNVMQNFFNDGAGKFRLRKSQWDSLNP